MKFWKKFLLSAIDEVDNPFFRRQLWRSHSGDKVCRSRRSHKQQLKVEGEVPKVKERGEKQLNKFLKSKL